MSYALNGVLLADGKGLLPQAFRPLPLGSVTPAGWLRDQLQFQAAGLSGHLDTFWPSIQDSAWVGGKNEGWERGPYWLDGLIPLAVLLDSAPLMHKARRWVDYILAHQRDDGWMGPVLKKQDGSPLYDTWPLYPLLKALTQWQEATKDERVVPAMQKLLRRVGQQISKEPIFEWGHFRTADFVVSIHWLHDRTREPWLLDLAEKVRSQSFDWAKLFADFPHKEKTPHGIQGSKSTHGVNIAMGVKQPGVWYRQTHSPEDREAAFQIIKTLDDYHGQATGVFTCDEHLAGKMPSQGTELCTVVEYMYSLEVLLSTLGRVELADRLEKLAFNALPAAFKPDYWAKQYDQQANQVVCKISEQRVYTDNGPDANLYGLEPHFGCCTANFSQGWPKFASHLWMAPAEGGLAAVAYAPCHVRAEVDGVPVTVRVETDYPFGEEVRIRLDPAHGMAFPLLLRVPAWAEGATVRVGADGPAAAARPGTFHRVEQTWQPGTELTLRLPMRARTRRRFNDAVAIERGPLVFSLNVPGDWRKVRGTLPYADWEVHPTADWNYALALDPAEPEDSVVFETKPVGEQPFSPEGAPVRARAKAKKAPGWKLENNAAAPPPRSPAATEGPAVEVELIPYAAAKLRVTEFPLADR